MVKLYDNEDNVCGICYKGKSYYFVKNLQGDVVSLVTKKEVNGEVVYTIVANYTYDAWGKCTIVFDSTDVSIATINPYRYRGYYYDAETGLYYLQSRYYDAEVGRFISGDKLFSFDTDRSVFSTNQFSYAQNDPVNEIDYEGRCIAKIIIRAIVGAIFGAVLQYLSDVLQNLIDCAADETEITKNIWKRRSEISEYVSAIVTSACDATLRIGAWKSFGIAISSTIVGHLIKYVKGRGFSVKQFIKDIVWTAFLSLAVNSITKKFTPKKGKELNKYIRKRFKVKGTENYKQYWILLKECVEWEGYALSTIISSIRSGTQKFLNFVETALKDCIIKAFSELFEE